MKFQQCVDFQNSPILTEYLQNIWESHQKHLKQPIEELAKIKRSPASDNKKLR